MSPKSHPEGIDSLRAAIAQALCRPQPITFYGPKSFVPADEVGPDKPCEKCGWKPGQTERPRAIASESLICGACHRASALVEARCHNELRRETQHQHLLQHNRNLTAATPVPLALVEADREAKAKAKLKPEPTPIPTSGRSRKRKEKAAC